MSEHWYQEAVFYELYLRAFSDGNGDGHGDFKGAIEKLDYVKSLGIDCIWILPMYPSPLRDDGYDVADFTDIHPDYGTLDDFQSFLDAAHKLELKVIIDLIFNHTSDQHPWFQAARNDPTSDFHDYYVWSDKAQKYSEARIIFIDSEESNWTYDTRAGKYFWHRFYSNQPDLNYDNPAVHEEMLGVIRFWLDMGVDGFRADAVPYLYEREGTNGENLPETHGFLKKVRRLLNEEYPGRIYIAEANQWPEDLLPYFGDGDEFHMCFHFPLMPRLYMALKRGNKEPILDVLAQTPAIPPGTQWLIFLRNHDELTLEMVTEEERQWMWEQYAPEQQMRLNQGIRRRLTPLVDNNRRKWLLLNALLLSLPGAPIIYYGDELGMGDNIDLPDRYGCRTPMQWSDGRNGGFSQASKSYLPVNDDPVFGYKQVNVKSQEADQSSFLWATRFLLEARSNTPALRKGTLEHLNVNNPALLAYWRVHEKSRLLCLYNLSDEQQAISLDLTAFQEFTVQDLLVPGEAEAVTAFPMVKLLAPHASHWLRLEKA